MNVPGPLHTPLPMSPAVPKVSPRSPAATTAAVAPKPPFPCPKLRLHIEDTSLDGCSVFLSNIHGHEDLSRQVENVLGLLYRPDALRPGTRSVTFVLREFSGVAFTKGTDLDGDHKEIHLSTEYIEHVAGREGTATRDEILGVICHELVHCFQWDAHQTCPGGLVEGVADWVRLRAGLAAKHWKQEADGDDWDAGYQKTAYFLEYLEHRFGEGTVRHINGCLRERHYNEKDVFGKCCGGLAVKDLWRDYAKHLKTRDGQ